MIRELEEAAIKAVSFSFFIVLFAVNVAKIIEQGKEQLLVAG